MDTYSTCIEKGMFFFINFSMMFLFNFYLFYFIVIGVDLKKIYSRFSTKQQLRIIIKF